MSNLTTVPLEILQKMENNLKIDLQKVLDTNKCPIVNCNYKATKVSHLTDIQNQYIKLIPNSIIVLNVNIAQIKEIKLNVI